ncbi:unnamed protein product [Camellia sinensis]
MKKILLLVTALGSILALDHINILGEDTRKHMNNRQSMEIGKENPDIFFTDREGRRNTKCLSWGIDKERVLKGKSAIEHWMPNTIGSSIRLVKSMQPAISNPASADSIISSKTDPNLCFATHAHSSISFFGLSVESSVADHQDWCFSNGSHGRAASIVS